MSLQSISCSTISATVSKPAFVYHEILGRFHSDWHLHDRGQLVYAENGFIHLRIAEKQFLLPGWHAVWIPSNTLHEMWSHSPDLILHSIAFPPEILNLPVFEKMSVFAVSPLLREMIRYSEKWHFLNDETNQERTFLQSIADILSGEMNHSHQTYLPATKHEGLAQILRYIQHNLEEKINISFLAQHFGYSERSLTRLFSTHLGMPFSGYCKVARMLKALELIENGEDNVSQVALQVGYESLATFSNTFLEVCGQRPAHLIQDKKLKTISRM
ncbi:helix-turn-helix transcriptional regulator [Cytophagaceae bacterium YF14B1]|uniref:Helix-turn-helix transcriptional regulator n=1 Tax=Xanthocytophaga flava TaxID=3048013 RepID=A0AAE3QQX6_9BACT|nr:helix-turn-helix transcriptional regulator [Xanthocytophaga flavus]MDJ1483246.1 helix-turn-helix transcriptional regulator [Xanthocytophaga flavus]